VRTSELPGRRVPTSRDAGREQISAKIAFLLHRDDEMIRRPGAMPREISA